MSSLSEEMVEDAMKERAEWLAQLGLKEGDVMVDREGREFIFNSSEDEGGEEHLTKVPLPYYLTIANIYD
jgi:hypothetical protein